MRQRPTTEAFELAVTDLHGTLLGDAPRAREAIQALLNGERLALRPEEGGDYALEGNICLVGVVAGARVDRVSAVWPLAWTLAA